MCVSRRMCTSGGERTIHRSWAQEFVEVNEERLASDLLPENRSIDNWSPSGRKQEDRMLKQLLAEATLDNHVLRELLRKNG